MKNERKYVIAAGLLASSCLLAMQACAIESSSALKDAWIVGAARDLRRLIVKPAH